MKIKNKYFAHKSCFVDSGAIIGEGTQIWHFSHIMKGAQIGRYCRIGQNVVIHSTVKIGNNVKIQNNVSLYDGVILEDFTFCGPSCVFTNITTPRSAYPRNTDEFYKKTIIKKGSSIGANATIVCGVTIGQNAFIGAGSVVTKDVGNNELVYGVPAKRHGWMCACGKKLEFINNIAKCSECKLQYKISDNKVTKN